MRPPESFVEQPVRSLQTMLRVIAKNDPRMPTVVPDGIYGPSTMNAVSAFQRQCGMPVTGIVDQNTWEHIVIAYEDALTRIGKAEPIEILLEPGQILKIGDSNPYIYLTQSMLTQLSHNHTVICQPGHSGVLDRSTADSLSDFQKLAGLDATGDLDRKTWKNLVKQFTLDIHRQNAKHAIDGNCE